MTASLPGWSPDLERSFKELLFRFLEEVQSTKASLYLMAPDGGYLLVAQYGFGRRDLLAAEMHSRDPVVIRCRELRDRPQAFNQPEEFAEAAAYLEGAGTARMLLVPFSAGSRVLGFVDARDKGRKRPFVAEDLERGAAIGAAILDLVRQAGLYGDLERPAVIGAPAAVAAVGGDGDAEPLLDERGLALVIESAEGLLGRPGIAAVGVGVVDRDTAGTLLLAVRGVELGDGQAVATHQRELLRQECREVQAPAEWRLDQRLFPGSAPASSARLLASGVLLRGPAWALLGSVVGAMGSDAAQRAVEALSTVAEAALEGARDRFARRRLARLLLQPSPEEVVELASHSLAVSRLAALLAQELGLAEVEVERAALAGLLHDVGMRQLDYQRLYRHPAPGPDERRTYQQHVLAGERLVREAGLADIAAAVRHHHERWDGRGYPDHLAGEAIPVLARLVHVAEVYDVLTSPGSYRRPVGPQRALETLRQGSGQQFDRELVERLARLA